MQLTAFEYVFYLYIILRQYDQPSFVGLQMAQWKSRKIWKKVETW